MTRDNEIPAIYNPRRVRAPSVVVTDDSPVGSIVEGNITNILNSNNPQILRSDSTGQADALCNLQSVTSNATITSNPATTTNANAAESNNSSTIIIGTSNNIHATTSTVTATSTTNTITATTVISTEPNNNVNSNNNNTITPANGASSTTKFGKCKESCCSELAQKMYFGVCVTILVTASWVGATHCIKFLYVYQNASQYAATTPSLISTNENFFYGDFENETNQLFQPIHIPTILPKNPSSSLSSPQSSSISSTASAKQYAESKFHAPFFAAWFCTNFMLLFFPIYLLGRLALSNCSETPGEILGNIIRGFRDRGFTAGRFLNRCIVFCLLWLITTHLYILSLRALLSTDAMSLFATNVASSYLLSWVILHEQFVGVRIVAVILCDTGIALLAYMDGITGSPTLGGVVLATISGAGYAVFKVMFRKTYGDPPAPLIAFTFTTLGFMNLFLCWPITLGLYLSGAEVMPLDSLVWIDLMIMCILMLIFHVLTQFSSIVTYNMFVTLGLITSVPVSAALDIVLYGANFAGMKLAGIILIAIGFFLIQFPNDWPSYITRLLRKTIRAFLRYQCCCEFDEIDYYHSKYHIAGAQREMGKASSKRLSFIAPNSTHRLSDGLHPFASAFAVRSGEIVDAISQQPFSGDHQSNWQLNERNASISRHYQRTLTSTSVIMHDDEFVTTPTKRLRGNSVLEESLLNAGNYIKRKFSYGSSD